MWLLSGNFENMWLVLVFPLLNNQAILLKRRLILFLFKATVMSILFDTTTPTITLAFSFKINDVVDPFTIPKKIPS